MEEGLSTKMTLSRVVVLALILISLVLSHHHLRRRRALARKVPAAPGGQSGGPRFRGVGEFT
jgi:hypothetical protein